MTFATTPHHDPTAVIGRRFGAYVVDMVVLLALIPAVIGLVIGLATSTQYEDGSTCRLVEQLDLKGSGEVCVDLTTTVNGVETDKAVTFNAAAFWVPAIVSLAYLVVVMWIVQGLTGASVGKALFGVRTVDEAGGPPGLGRQLLRGVLWVIPDGLGICGLPLVAILTILLTKGHRRVGDMAAKTYVVGKGDAGRPVVVPGVAAPATQAPPPYPSSAPPAPGTATAPPPAATWAPPPAPGTTPPPGPGDAGWAAPAGAADEPPTSTFAPPTTSQAPVGDEAGSTPAPEPLDGEATEPPAAEPAPPAEAPTVVTPVTEPEVAPEPEPKPEPFTRAMPPPAQPAADAPTVEQAPPAGQPPAAGGPQWDPARGAYVYWDPHRQAWLVHDAATGEWKPLT